MQTSRLIFPGMVVLFPLLALGCDGPLKGSVGPSDGGPSLDTDAGPGTGNPDGGALAADGASPGQPPSGTPGLGFIPSNITLSGLDLAHIGDADVLESCTIQTDIGDAEDCFPSAAAVGDVVQSDGSRVHVVVVKTLKVEPNVTITVTGGLPLALVATGDMTILGTIDAHATNDVAVAGGFGTASQNAKGAGPGGGAAASGVEDSPGAAAGGGSYCGRGGLGALEPGVPAEPAAYGATYGSPPIVPLVGGSSGGSGTVGAGAGGGAIQLVSSTVFTLATFGAIDVGGGGGPFAGTVGQEAGGGGSGGSILIEAPVVTIAGTLAANGGGGGGATGDGRDGTPNTLPALGGAGGSRGGDGSASTIIDGSNGIAGTDPTGAGAGGGGGGRIRINSQSGSAALAGSVISPAVGTACATQGKTGGEK